MFRLRTKGSVSSLSSASEGYRRNTNVDESQRMHTNEDTGIWNEYKFGLVRWLKRKIAFSK